MQLPDRYTATEDARSYLQCVRGPSCPRGSPPQLATCITPGEYLPLDFWNEIVALCGFHNEIQPIRKSWAHRFRIVCVDPTWIGHGEDFPRGSRPGPERLTLVMARVNENHFVPLFRAH